MASNLAIPYPNAEQWKQLLNDFSSEAIAHKLLLSSVPYVFRNEPLKFALFRRTIADAFNVDPTDIFIVGSALTGRSLKGRDINKEYSSDSDIDTLIISEHLFTSHVMQSLDWVAEVTAPDHGVHPTLVPDTIKQIGRVAMNAGKGIWRPDSLPKGVHIREDFFDRFGAVSLKVLGLQLSEDTVSKVTGRIARSFDHAVADLASSLSRLSWELSELEDVGSSPKQQNGNLSLASVAS